MEPIFTIQWPEFLIANRLQTLLPKSSGYSICIPASRQQKGFDLAIIRTGSDAVSRVATFQVKASRTYFHKVPKRETTSHFTYYTWFNRFDVPDEADFILLVGLYSPDVGRTRRINAEYYKDCTLLFTRFEMKHIIGSCLTRGGKPDKMFGFGFDDESKVVQTRGDQHRQNLDFTKYLLNETRVDLVRRKLAE